MRHRKTPKTFQTMLCFGERANDERSLNSMCYSARCVSVVSLDVESWSVEFCSFGWRRKNAKQHEKNDRQKRHEKKNGIERDPPLLL